MTVFATVSPARKFRFDVPGMAVPDGHTVRCPPLCGPVTVTVATTAAAPLPGIPPRPATCIPTVPRPATAPGICSPARESAIRAGVTDTTAPATTAALDGMATGSAETAEAVTAPATTRARPAITTRKWAFMTRPPRNSGGVSYTHLRAHETDSYLV